MVSQQVGYQVGDFFVQVQSGTSALVAFGQQGTQLAGLLPGVAGAVVGISLAVGTMLLRSLLEGAGAVKDFQEEFQQAQEAVDSLKDSLELLSEEDSKLEETFGNYTSYVKGLEQAALSAAKTLARIELGESVAALAKEIDDGFFDGFTPIGKMIFGEKGGALKALGLQNTGLKEQDFLNLKVNIETESLEDAAEDVEFIIDRINKRQGDLTKEGSKFLIKLKDVGVTLAQQIALLNGSAKAAEDSNEAIKDFADLEKIANNAIKGINKYYSKIAEDLEKAAEKQAKLLKSAQDQLAVEKLRLTSLQGYNSEGEKTQDILDAEVALAAEIVKKKWEQKFALNGISQEEQKLIAALVDQAELQERAEQSIKKAKDDAREFAKEMASAARASEKLANFLSKSDDKLPALRAKLSVLRAGGSRGEADIAGAAAGARSAVTEAYGGSLAGAPPSVIGEADKYVANKAEEARLQAEINELLKTKKELTNIKDDIRDAEEKLKLDRASVFATREEIGYLTILRDLKQANKDADIGMDPSALDKTAKRLAQYQEETKHLEDLRDLTTDWAQSFGDAIVSVVDGTEKAKDAFNNLALAIVKDLYDIFVVKQITGFITGTVGNTWSDLGKVGVGGYDGGGYTGNGPRSGGLDGKGGFMAMLHPKETVVDHTKGGSSGVVVNQTINVSTGVQQTVRAEVMGLMPQIAAASKGAVLDAKRRGGAYAGAF